MALKRGATTELNHENWNQEEKPEDKGNFAHAPSEELQNRVIKKAKRKLKGEETTDKSVFSGFKGFGSIASASTVSSTSSPFSFLSKLSSSSTTTVNSIQKQTTKQGVSANSDGDKSKDFQFDHSATYYANLKALNQAVSKWIKQHVDENPLCILSPIFQDYEKYLTEINDQQKNGNTFGRTNSFAEAVTDFKLPPIFTTNNTGTSVSSSSNTFTFSTVKPTESKLPETSISTTLSSCISSSHKPFSLSVSKTNEATKPTGFIGFTFSSTTNKPFTFARLLNQQSSNTLSTNKQDNKDITTGEDDDTDDQPPKVEFTPVAEEGSVYSKRCKVFIKDDNNYKDLGIGTLHLKPLKDKDKTQLIIRADTNIGKILLNLILNDGIPAQRMGKNNVMMVCIPTPEASEQKAVAVLLRVKTGEEADELLETINKYKN